MKKILSTVCMFLLLLSTLTLSGCKKAKKEETIMNISCNPSVEFILDKDNKVVSVTALNEDGNVILVGETFIGLTADEAAKLFVKISTETGFIVEGSTSNNEVKVSISGDNKKANQIYDDVKSKVSKYLSDNNINANLKNIEAPTLDELKALVKDAYPTIKDEILNSLSESELIKYLKEVRILTKDLFSQGLKDAFVAMKDYEIEFAKDEKTLEIINTLDSTYSLVISQYSGVIKNLNSAKVKLEEARNEYLLSETSDYQLKLKELNNAKDELLKAKNELANMEEGLAKQAKALEVASLETAYGLKETAYNTYYNSANLAIDNSLLAINTIIKSLETLKENMPEEIKTILQNKANEIEDAANTAKNDLLESFENSYNEQIEAARDAALARKTALKNAVSAN